MALLTALSPVEEPGQQGIDEAEAKKTQRPGTISCPKQALTNDSCLNCLLSARRSEPEASKASLGLIGAGEPAICLHGLTVTLKGNMQHDATKPLKDE